MKKLKRMLAVLLTAIMTLAMAMEYRKRKSKRSQSSYK